MSATMAPLVPALDDAARRGTGCLHVTGPATGQQAQVYFEGGQVYAIHLHGFTPLVGRRLLSNGSLTTDQYATLLARANGNEQDPGIGVQAVKAGYFRQDVLDDVLREILLAAFRDILSWDAPSTKFRRRARTTHLTAPATPITTLLQAARRRGTQWQSWWTASGFDPATVKPYASEMERDDDDPDGVSRLLSVADGSLGLRAIAHACGLTYFETGHAFLDLFNDGRVTFLTPTPKEFSMHPAIPVTHIAPAIDAVPVLPLPPLPNFDGQTLPPTQAQVQVHEQGQSVATAPEDGPEHPSDAPAVVEVEQRIVAVGFDVTAAFEAAPGAPEAPDVDAAAPEAQEVAEEMGTADAAGEVAEEVAQEIAEEALATEEMCEPAHPSADPREVAQRALLADELDAVAAAVRLAEATIERLRVEEQAHHEAAEQSLNHLSRYEHFLLAAEEDRQQLLDEQRIAENEVEALTATADDLAASRSALDETLAQAVEQADEATLALQKAQAEHEAAMLALHQAREAAGEVSAMLADMTAASDLNRERAVRIADDLSTVEGRARAYAQEIAEAKQVAEDLMEAAQASARLRERAEQRLAAAQATLSAKEAQRQA